MIKIDFNSRYYNDFQKTKSIIDYDKLFKREYNEDKRCYYTIYRKLINPNISFVDIAKEYFDNINSFFEKELFNDNEKKLLVENLLEYIKDYGNAAISNLGMSEYEIARKIMKQHKFKIWREFTVDIIIDNKDKFSDNTNYIITYLLNLKNELLRIFNDNIEPTFEFKNNFDRTGIKQISSHFITHLVDRGHLDKNDLEKYLFQAFELKSIPDKKFILKGTTSKKDIYKIFYLYYKDIAGKPFGRQKDYAGLLGEYFEGYETKNVKTNFSKSIY